MSSRPTFSSRASARGGQGSPASSAARDLPGVVLFTRDLRVNDHPALAAAVAEHNLVVPAFIFDDRLTSSRLCGANRLGFLLQCLDDLDESLRDLGAGLVTRRGDWVQEALRLVVSVGARTIYLSDDRSPYGRARADRLEARARSIGVLVHRFPGISAVAPGEIAPAGQQYYQVFTPYHRRWLESSRREIAPRPLRIAPVPDLDVGALPFLQDLSGASQSRLVPPGGEHAARWRLSGFIEHTLGEYGSRKDDLAADATSHLSSYLHFGCISPIEVLFQIGERNGAEPLTRQLCWRDFFYQVLAARPEIAWADFKARGDSWDEGAELLEVWKEGRTGYPVVDAAMRQLAREGHMHNRARMVAASFLTKDLYLDWREGARHFGHLLVDADISSNNLSWQWIAGTGTDTSPQRIFNPTVQAKRYDPMGRYIRRYVPELCSLPAALVHDPDTATRDRLGYPRPIVDHTQAVARLRARRSLLAGRSDSTCSQSLT